MLGHVMDFGIERLIGESSLDSLTSTRALKGTMSYITPSIAFKISISLIFSH
jgi:hypothetical protein